MLIIDGKKVVLKKENGSIVLSVGGFETVRDTLDEIVRHLYANVKICRSMDKSYMPINYKNELELLIQIINKIESGELTVEEEVSTDPSCDFTIDSAKSHLLRNNVVTCKTNEIWQQLFNIYRENGGDMNNMSDMLIDRDDIRKALKDTNHNIHNNDSRCCFSWTMTPNSNITEFGLLAEKTGRYVEVSIVGRKVSYQRFVV